MSKINNFLFKVLHYECRFCYVMAQNTTFTLLKDKITEARKPDHNNPSGGKLKNKNNPLWHELSFKHDKKCVCAFIT